MKIDGKHPVRQALRAQIRKAEADGCITLTKDEFIQMILKVEAFVPRRKQFTQSWKSK